MSDFLDPTDVSALDGLLSDALAALGLDVVVAELATVPGLRVTLGRPAGVLRSGRPHTIQYGDRQLSLSKNSVVDEHIVGEIRLSSTPIAPLALPKVLAELVASAVSSYGGGDDVAVRLTALRDALAAGR